jgi:uncharacterized membrane protein YkoI
MKSTVKLSPFLIAAAIAVSPLTAALAYSGQQYAPQAKVTLEQARTVALKAFPGTITDEELEKESGGSGLRYSFDIKSGAATHEVGVDAQAGTVLENSAKGPHSD